MITWRAVTTLVGAPEPARALDVQNELNSGREFDARRQAQPVFFEIVHRAVLLDGVELLAFLRPEGRANDAAAALVTVDDVPSPNFFISRLACLQADAFGHAGDFGGESLTAC